LSYSSNNTLIGNILARNNFGIELYYSPNNTLINNTAYGNFLNVVIAQNASFPNNPFISDNGQIIMGCVPFDLDNNGDVDIFDVVTGLEYLSGEKSEIFNKGCSGRISGKFDFFDLLTLISELGTS